MPRIIKSSKGTFTSSTVTIDSSGRVIAAASGAGGAVMTPKLFATGPATGTYTSNGNSVTIYASSGGGGGSGVSNTGGNNIRGGAGGYGVQGIFTSDITPPFSQPYAVGGPGARGNNASSGNNGSAGGATNVANLITLNGGNGATYAGENTNGNPGNPGTAAEGSFLANATFNSSANNGASTNDSNLVVIKGKFGNGGTGTQRNTAGISGGKGLLYIFDNA
tara:strand:+ start:290 stop:952 length:663 start_codon:yes stop_codon:yes gene_type:complete